MRGKLRLFMASFCLLLPWFLKRSLLQLAFGYKLHPKSRIGFSLVLADALDLDEGAEIGHFTAIGRVSKVELAPFAKIGNFNWISGLGARNTKHFSGDDQRRPVLQVGEHSSITARHYIDCCDHVHIGKFSTIAGARSQILTHEINLRENQQQSAPVRIGDYCLVGTGCVILKGAVLPNRSVLAAGSTLTRTQSSELTIYSGVPAVPVKKLPADSLYFHRTNGFVA